MLLRRSVELLTVAPKALSLVVIGTTGTVAESVHVLRPLLVSRGQTVDLGVQVLVIALNVLDLRAHGLVELVELRIQVHDAVAEERHKVGVPATDASARRSLLLVRDPGWRVFSRRCCFMVAIGCAEDVDFVLLYRGRLLVLILFLRLRARYRLGTARARCRLQDRLDVRLDLVPGDGVLTLLSGRTGSCESPRIAPVPQR